MTRDIVPITDIDYIDFIYAFKCKTIVKAFTVDERLLNWFL